MTIHCEAKLPTVLGGWLYICDQPATETWEYACVHEHVLTGHTCAEHRPAPGDVGCKQCWDTGHECPLSARPVETTPT